MTETFVRSRDGFLSGKIPQGWYSGTEDFLGTALTLLLISDAADATLSVKVLVPDQLTAKQLDHAGIELLGRISASSRFDDNETTIPELREFDLKGREYCSYEYTKGIVRQRVVVFISKGRYYECEIRGGKKNWTESDYVRLFRTQQTFLSSLTY